ncbi:MAG: aminotransferase DegT [Deltaproteobacteria bacterium]|nr:aminotransferase DegT [Deltaproteobacteria bacterium]
MRFENPIFVTRSTVAPLNHYSKELESVWESGIFTHNGPKVRRFESEINRFLGCDSTVAVTNGTIAIQIAMRALDLTGGEIITTPFSWIATCSSILWERCTPVFVDIDPNTLNIDPSKIEAAVTKQTRAILGVHVFSNPCDVVKIDTVAKKHHLKVIYDGAHAFGVQHLGRSLLDFGDISTTSFHATKLLSSGEGGAVFANGSTKERLQSIRFFGHDPEKNIIDTGCNGKMTELHAALGLINLPLVPSILQKRKAIYQQYRSILDDKVRYQHFSENAYNFSYMPIILDSEKQLLRVIEELNANNVFPRRYFYPSLNTVNAVKEYTPCPISEDISSRIMTLPSYHDLDLKDVTAIAKMVLATL